MKSNMRIKSEGHAMNTKVFIGDTEVSHVTNIEFKPLKAGEPVQATITVTGVQLDIKLDEYEVINHE